MKHIILSTITLCIMLTCNAQYNFSIKNSQVVWQKIYQTQLTFEEVVDITKSNSNLREFNLVDSTIHCRFSEQRPDLSKRMSMPIYYSTSTISGIVTIQYKQGRYRVTIEKITLAMNSINKSFNLNSHNSAIYPIEDYAIKKGNWKTSFWGDVMFEYNKLFESLVEMKKASHLGDDW